MRLHISSYCIVDTAMLVMATPCAGENEHDGRYGIHLVFAIGEQAKRVFIDYPSKEARDVDFQRLGDACRDDMEQEQD